MFHKGCVLGYTDSQFESRKSSFAKKQSEKLDKPQPEPLNKSINVDLSHKANVRQVGKSSSSLNRSTLNRSIRNSVFHPDKPRSVDPIQGFVPAAESQEYALNESR